MPKTFLPDPKLAALVRELNHSDVQPADDVGQPWPPEHVPEGNPLERMLTDMAQRGASDLLLIDGVPPVMRIGGGVVPFPGPPPGGHAHPTPPRHLPPPPHPGRTPAGGAAARSGPLARAPRGRGRGG